MNLFIAAFFFYKIYVVRAREIADKLRKQQQPQSPTAKKEEVKGTEPAKEKVNVLPAEEVKNLVG